MKPKYDRATKAWFNSHICQQTTVCRCEKCGLFYKPSLGHKCKAKDSYRGYLGNDVFLTKAEAEQKLKEMEV